MVMLRKIGTNMILLLSLCFLINKIMGIKTVGYYSISINELGGEIE